MTTLRSSLLALALSAGVAAAATMPATAEGIDRGRYDRGAPHVLPSWSGIYAGVHLGNAEVEFDDGLLGGVQIGHNWQRGSVVFGLEGDVSFSDIEDLDVMGTVRGRLGYLILPNILLYGTAGVGFVDDGNGRNGRGDDDTDAELVYGLGIEGRLTDRTTLRLEYLGFDDTDIEVVRVGVNFKLGAWGW